MKQNLTIISHEDKTSKNGKDYCRFKTNIGWTSVFDAELIKDIKKAEGSTLECEIQEKDDYKNIIKVYGVVASEDEKPIVETVKMGNTTSQNTTFYTSYAKDIFIAAIAKDDTKLTIGEAEAMMNVAINLVKQARDSF